MKRKIFNSSAAKITKVYATMLTGITIAISVAMIALVGTYLFNVRVQETGRVMDGMEHYFVTSKDDWKWWRIGSPIDTKTTFVKAEFNYAHKKNQSFYSPGARRFVRDNQRSKVQNHLFKNTYYSTKNGVYYRLTRTYQADPAEGLPVIHYQVWMKFNNNLGLLGKLIKIIILIAVACFVIGTCLIYLLARRLNQPLVNLTKYTHEINAELSQKYTVQLPVPKGPQEVHNLSIEFNQLLDSLKQQSRADRQFVSNASHELKTPIAGIRGHAELIKRRGQEHPEIIPTSIDFIDEESKRIQGMIESLLKLSHANQLELPREEVNLSALVTSVVTRYEQQLARKINLAVTADVMGQVNAESIEQILISLLDNARKYSEDQSPIEVRLAVVGEHIQLSVADWGSGIADADKPHVFERFFRAKSVQDTDQAVAGNGLGLAIVQQLVTLNHGTITVTDHQPQGSIFVITLQQN